MSWGGRRRRLPATRAVPSPESSLPAGAPRASAHDRGELVALALYARVREQGIVARFGGEEFAVLHPHTGLDAAILVAETLRCACHDAATVGWTGGERPAWALPVPHASPSVSAPRVGPTGPGRCRYLGGLPDAAAAAARARSALRRAAIPAPA